MEWSIETLLSKIDEWEREPLPEEFKDYVKMLDGFMSKIEGLLESEPYFRALLACVMYWMAKKIPKSQKWSEREATYQFYTMQFMHEICHLCERLAEVALGGDE